MCYKTTCPSCKKASWGGCGAHVEMVLGHLSAAERCQCRAGGAASAPVQISRAVPVQVQAARPAQPAQPVQHVAVAAVATMPVQVPAVSSSAAASADVDMSLEYDWDLIVIGGGSGGLAAGKEAASLGARVALFDFVEPTPSGTKWGLGGTCVNVGCIPKKIMHYASILGASRADAAKLGWTTAENESHNWEKLRQTVKEYILSLNFGYRKQLKDKQVNYINAYASFIDPHTVEYSIKVPAKRELEVKRATARNFLIAVGGRPNYPDIPGAKEFGVTSDDLFSLPQTPGRTLCVGASYISLECAGFLAELNYSSTVMVRSQLLRGFDREIAAKVEYGVVNAGVNFIREANPVSLEKNADTGLIRVTYSVAVAGIDEEKKESELRVEEFNTVLFAIGRHAQTEKLGLSKAGVVFSQNDGKIKCVNDCTNVAHIYAVGDAVQGVPELTPVAVMAGRLLARRLYANATQFMNYDLIPTTVFTPMEYGLCGLSEEEAIKRFGADDVEVYVSEYDSLELSSMHRVNHVGDPIASACMMKIICRISDQMRVIGFHVVSPNAGEITQGVALAMRLKATKADLDLTVGIHPTSAEEFTTLTVTKRSNASSKKTGC